MRHTKQPTPSQTFGLRALALSPLVCPHATRPTRALDEKGGSYRCFPVATRTCSVCCGVENKTPVLLLSRQWAAACSSRRGESGATLLAPRSIANSSVYSSRQAYAPGPAQPLPRSFGPAAHIIRSSAEAAPTQRQQTNSSLCCHANNQYMMVDSLRRRGGVFRGVSQLAAEPYRAETSWLPRTWSWTPASLR